MKKQLLTLATLIIGFLAGASALSVFANSDNWQGPCDTPPKCNADAPINVGTSLQEKAGGLWLHSGLSVDGNVIIATGTPTAGYVLTAVDNIGTAKWSPAGALNAVTKIIPGIGIRVSPASGTGNVTVTAPGTVGGGCYQHGHSNVPVYHYDNWGNATAHDTQIPGPGACTCPTGYSVVTVDAETAYLCLAN